VAAALSASCWTEPVPAEQRAEQRAEPRDAPVAIELGALVRLAPTAQDVRRETERALEQRIAKTLAALPEVATAHVQLSLPSAAETPLDAVLPAASAVVVLTQRNRTASDADVAAIVRGALGRADVELALVRRELIPQPPRTVSIGPFRVEQSSARALRATLLVMLVTNALLALLLLLRARRARRDRPLLPEEPKVDPRDRSRV
jgi:type III secretory pathway lipoprotein EscJ